MIADEAFSTFFEGGTLRLRYLRAWLSQRGPHLPNCYAQPTFLLPRPIPFGVFQVDRESAWRVRRADEM